MKHFGRRRSPKGPQPPEAGAVDHPGGGAAGANGHAACGASRQSAAYHRYMDALNSSVLYAREHDGRVAGAGRQPHPVGQQTSSAGRGRYQRKARQAGMGKAPAGAAGGRGCDPGLGRRQSSAAVGRCRSGAAIPLRETFGVFVAYTYPDGETYCYDTDNLGWDRVVDSLPSAG